MDSKVSVDYSMGVDVEEARGRDEVMTNKKSNRTTYRLVARNGHLFLQFKTTRQKRRFLRLSTHAVSVWQFLPREADTAPAFDGDKVSPDAYVSSTSDHADELKTFMKTYPAVGNYFYEIGERFKEWITQVKGK